MANRRDLPTLVEHLNAGGANAVSAGGVDASVADTGDLLMHLADEPTALDTLHPVPLRAREGLGGVAVWRGEVHVGGILRKQLAAEGGGCAHLAV